MKKLNEAYQRFKEQLEIPLNTTRKSSFARHAFASFAYHNNYTQEEIASVMGYKRSMVSYIKGMHACNADKLQNPKYAKYYNFCYDIASKCYKNESLAPSKAVEFLKQELGKKEAKIQRLEAKIVLANRKRVNAERKAKKLEMALRNEGFEWRYGKVKENKIMQTEKLPN